MPDSDSPQPTCWLVGDYRFDANSHRLSGNACDLVLEPKSAALLAYFCQHPGRDIGRDELLDAVWHGQIVSDNSISRVVVLLRKALQDDNKARQYIATVPKLGYRFIADVSEVEKTPAHGRASVSAHSDSASWWRYATLGVLLAGVSLAALLQRSDLKQSAQAGREIVPLSRLAVSQSNAHLASDGKHLLYTASDGVWDVIYLADGTGAEPIPISVAGGNANFAAWSPNGEFVVYQFISGNRCEFHRVEREKLQARLAEVFYPCVPGSYSELSVAPDNDTVYFVERVTPHAPYAAFAIDMSGRTKRRLSQPAAVGYGNHFIDVHPHSGALLLLSDHAPGKTSVYALNPANDSFALQRAFDYGLDSAIWSHQPGFVVHPSRHPSYQLMESSLTSDDSFVVVSDSRRIASPKRIAAALREQNEYSFASYLFNRDIAVSGYPSERFSSAVMDYLPAISNSGEKLAFISKRSGDSQIWIKGLGDDGLTAIEPPDPGRRFHNLVWSADDQQLLANTNTGILIYSFAENAFLHDIALPLPAYGVGWRDPKTLSLSQYEKDRWQAYQLPLDSGKAVPADSRWAFSLQNAQQTLYLDQDLTVFRDGEELTSLRQCASVLWRYQLRLRLDGEAIYCHAADASDDLLRFDADMNMTRLVDTVNRYEFFSVRNGVIANTFVASSSSDIMQTRIQK